MSRERDTAPGQEPGAGAMQSRPVQPLEGYLNPASVTEKVRNIGDRHLPRGPVARDVEDLSARLAHLRPEDADHLISILRDRAARRRLRLSVQDVRVVYENVLLSPAWLRSRVVCLGRVRATAKDLVLAGWWPEQFAESLAEIGLEGFPNGGTVALAISEGVGDADWLRS